MRLILGVILLCIPLLSLAALPDCYQGQWQINSRKSDNPERLLNKLARKHKQQQRAIYRSDEREDSSEDLSLIDTLPRFVFLLQDLQIEIQPEFVLFHQLDFVRKISTNNNKQAVSLKSLQEHSETRVAGWDNESLVVETTAIDGTHVTETFVLQDEAKTLHVDMVIKKELEKEMKMEKVYQRDMAPAICQPL